MLKGLDQRIAAETGIGVHLVNAPLEAVVLGAGRCVESYDELRVMFMGARD
jgi:rod shape-determining protein MreB